VAVYAVTLVVLERRYRAWQAKREAMSDV